MPSLLARRRAAAASKTGADLSLGSGDGGGSANSATSRKDSGSSLFNLKPLSLYKVPDTLTSAAICANYNIYLSQRPEKAEVDAVRSVRRYASRTAVCFQHGRQGGQQRCMSIG